MKIDARHKIQLAGNGVQLFDGSTGQFIPGGHEELDQRTPHKGSMNILLKTPEK